MLPAASRIYDHARRNHHLLGPLLLAVLAATAHVHSPVQHQLFIASASWAATCAATLFWAGIRPSEGKRRRSAWLAGGFWALAVICDRAACDKEGTWSTKVPRPHHEMEP